LQSYPATLVLNDMLERGVLPGNAVST